MNALSFITTSKYTNTGLLILRAGMGIMFFLHGFPKLTGGIETWTFLGSTMSNLGINFAYPFWGFLAAFSESIGGLFLAAGLLTRLAAAGLFFTMFTATVMHLSNGDGLMGSAHPIEAGIVFLAFVAMGAGKYSIDHLLAKHLKK